jgi:hypothetical protein
MTNIVDITPQRVRIGDVFDTDRSYVYRDEAASSIVQTNQIFTKTLATTVPIFQEVQDNLIRGVTSDFSDSGAGIIRDTKGPATATFGPFLENYAVNGRYVEFFQRRTINPEYVNILLIDKPPVRTGFYQFFVGTASFTGFITRLNNYPLYNWKLSGGRYRYVKESVDLGYGIEISRNLLYTAIPFMSDSESGTQVSVTWADWSRIYNIPEVEGRNLAQILYLSNQLLGIGPDGVSYYGLFRQPDTAGMAYWWDIWTKKYNKPALNLPATAGTPLYNFYSEFIAGALSDTTDSIRVKTNQKTFLRFNFGDFSDSDVVSAGSFLFQPTPLYFALKNLRGNEEITSSSTSIDPNIYLRTFEGLPEPNADDQVGSLPIDITLISPTDALRYIASYPDLIQTLGADVRKGQEHYRLNAVKDNRTILFNPYSYLNLHSDLRSIYGYDVFSATQHYIVSGFAAGRQWQNASLQGSVVGGLYDERTGATPAVQGSIVWPNGETITGFGRSLTYKFNSVAYYLNGNLDVKEKRVYLKVN